MSETKVLIGVVTGEYNRRADFYDFFNMLKKPPNTMVMFCHDRSPAKGRNLIAEQAIIYNCSHILFVDDDMAYRDNALLQLLEHKDVDIVSGLYLSRAYPHQPLIFSDFDIDGYAFYIYLDGKEERLIKIAAAGLGFCLVRIEVFKILEKPWFRLGELDSEEWCDDIGFFSRVKKSEFQVFCDTECRVGHMGTYIVWAEHFEGKWYSNYDTNGKGGIRTPQIHPKMTYKFEK